MPHYDYKCTECGKTFEVFQKMTDEPLSKCPECKGKVNRLIGAGCGLIFKGNGFYVTDYKKNKKAHSPVCDGACRKKTAAKPAANTSATDKTADKESA